MTSGDERSARKDKGIDDLPPDELAPYNDEQRQAFMAAYHSALEQHPGDHERALEVAHAAARGTPGER